MRWCLKISIDINKEMKIIKSNQKEILELKVTITDMYKKNSLEGTNSWSEQIKEKISKLKDQILKNYPIWGAEKKKNKEKWIKSKGPVGHHQADQPRHYKSIRRRRGKRHQKNTWRNNGQKLPKYDEIHEYTYPKSSKNSKQDKLKEIYIKIYYSQIVEIQRQRECWKLQERYDSSCIKGLQ